MGTISNPVIYDISSDEEGADEERDWLSELLDATESANDDSDEVVIVGEVSGAGCKGKETVKASAIRDDLDDDCLILDGDPDDQVSAVADTGNESDELLVVGEKGQLACRDYPHPRHLCITFPFSTSAHGKYCTLCHCYVCDSPAPCAYWGTGFSSSDHCHSTDKEAKWKALRKCFKQGQTIQGPMQKKSEAIQSVGRPLHKPIPMSAHSQPLNCGSFPVHTVPKPTVNRACPSVQGFGVPSTFCRKTQRVALLSMDRNPAPRRSQPMMGAHSVVGRERITSTTGPLCVNAHPNFKRVGSTGTAALRKNQYAHGSSNNGIQYAYKAHVSQPQRMPPVAHSGEYHNNKHEENFGPISSGFGTCQSSQSTNIPRNTLPSAAPVYCSQQNGYQNVYPNPNPNPPGFNYGWMCNPPQNLATPAEQHLYPSVQPSAEPSPIPDTVSPCPENGGVNPSLPDFHLDSWINALENQVGTGDLNHTVPSAVGYVPFPTDMLDEGNLLFDFENDLLRNV